MLNQHQDRAGGPWSDARSAGAERLLSRNGSAVAIAGPSWLAASRVMLLLCAPGREVVDDPPDQFWNMSVGSRCAIDSPAVPTRHHGAGSTNATNSSSAQTAAERATATILDAIRITVETWDAWRRPDRRSQAPDDVGADPASPATSPRTRRTTAAVRGPRHHCRTRRIRLATTADRHPARPSRPQLRPRPTRNPRHAPRSIGTSPTRSGRHLDNRFRDVLPHPERESELRLVPPTSTRLPA